MAVLSQTDLDFFEANGFVTVHDAVPSENLDAVIDAVWEFLGMDRDNPEDWYHEPHRKGGMVEIYQHQSLWNNRQNPKIYEAFTQIWGVEELWVSRDRACMKPPRHPNHPDWDHKGFIHWDADMSTPPIHFGVQGVLCLADTAANQGGFQCVPGMHREIVEWAKTHTPERENRRPDLDGRKIEPIPGKAGDFIIWHKALPHGNGHNVADKPRLSQYITMGPNMFHDEEARKERVESWRTRVPMKGWPGDDRLYEHNNWETAELTSLGRKLLGLDAW